MKIKTTGADPLFIACAIYGAFTQSAWWLVVIPLVVASWVFNPRWDSASGWRFFHD